MKQPFELPGKDITRRRFLGAAVGAACATALPLVVQSGSAERGYLLGCYTRPWDQWDYRVALDGIAEAGFRYAGLMTAKGKSWVIIGTESTEDEVRSIAAEARQRGLQILSIYGGDFPVARSLEAGIQGLRKLIDLCAICACPNLLLGGTTDEKVFAAYYEAVAECCSYARDRKVGLSIKPHGGQNATGPQCRAILKRVGSEQFRLWYDPGNIFYYSDGKLDPVDDVSAVDGLVAGMSIKDFVPPKEVLVTPGTGRVKFSEVLRKLRAGGFRAGPLLVECVAKRDTPAAVTAEAKAARRFIEALPEFRD